jgi:hypothetical protein
MCSRALPACSALSALKALLILIERACLDSRALRIDEALEPFHQLQAGSVLGGEKAALADAEKRNCVPSSRKDCFAQIGGRFILANKASDPSKPPLFFQ